MTYLGGKVRLGKAIADVLKELRLDASPYFEPFVGACGVMTHMEGERYGSDYHPQLIALWQAIQAGWLPPKHVSAEEYRQVRNDPTNYSSHYAGYVGFACSFKGKWFGGYSGVYTKRDYIQEARKRLLKIRASLEDVHFSVSAYQDLQIPDGALVYCDPPYHGREGYKQTPVFNHAEFWEWIKALSTRCVVVTSELTAPPGVKSIWSLPRKITTSITSREAVVERLFRCSDE